MQGVFAGLAVFVEGRTRCDSDFSLNSASEDYLANTKRSSISVLSHWPTRTRDGQKKRKLLMKEETNSETRAITCFARAWKSGRRDYARREFSSASD